MRRYHLETPGVAPLPWEIDKPVELTPAERQERSLQRASLVIGVLGGLAGLYFSLRELRRMWTGHD